MFSLNPFQNELAFQNELEDSSRLSHQPFFSPNLLQPAQTSISANRSERTQRSTRQLFDWKQLSPTGSVHTKEQITEQMTGPMVVVKPSFGRELSTLFNRLSPKDAYCIPEINGVCADVSIAEYKLRLYALVWTDDTLDELDPRLFLLLGPVAGSYLPIDSQLSIKEDHLLLSEQKMRWTHDSTYLCSQVLGLWKLKFTVEILLPNARPLAMPPLILAAAGAS